MISQKTYFTLLCYKTIFIFRNSHAQRDFHAAQTFLTACYDGPFISLMNRLTETYPLFEYPSTQLPILTQNQSNGNVCLPAFEFYFYHFFNLPLRRQNLYQGSSQGNATDSLYPILVEDYLTTYLPAESTYQRKLFAQGHTAPGSFHQQIQNMQQYQNIKTTKNVDLVQNLNNSQGASRSTLLRKDFSIASVQTQHPQDISSVGIPLSPTSGNMQPISPLNKNRTSNGVISEIWKSETFARILIAFWLESYANRNVEVYHSNTGSPSSPTTYTTPLPSQELLRCVRMFIKHAHYFSNACKEGGSYVPDSLKYSSGAADIFSTNGGIGGSLENNANPSGNNNKTLFLFLSLCIDHWPLDASFRLVLETWLSYIQPWRYTQMQNSKSNSNKNDSNEALDTSKWSNFVDENVVFFTNILGKLLFNRFSRLDMSSNKNAYMLYRIAKVYSQENLVGMIAHASNMQGGRPIFQNISNASPRHMPTMNLSMTEDVLPSNLTKSNASIISVFVNGPGTPTNPIPLLGSDFKQLVTSLLQNLFESKQVAMRTRKIAENLNRSQTEKDKAISFPSKLVAFVADVLGIRNSVRPSSPGSNGMDAAEKIEYDKTISYIEFSIENFSSIFELESIVENLQLQISSSQSISKDNVTSTISPADEVTAGGLSPLQRKDILLKKVKVYSKYDGNPDRVPVRSDEFGFLVKVLLYLSFLINKKWGLKIEDWYERKPGFAYAVFRQICSAPCIYRSSGIEFYEDNSTPIENEISDNLNNTYCRSMKRFDPSNKRRLPARIILRPLASYKLLFYLLMSYLVLSLWQRSLISSVFVMFLLYSLWLMAKAMVEYASEQKSTDPNNKVVDMTINNTILSPDNSF